MPGRLASRAYYLAKERQGGHRSPLLEVLLQRLLAEALQLLGQDVAAGLVLRPVANLGKPPLVVLAGVAADLPLGLAADLVLRLRQPPGFTAPMRAMATLCRAARVSSPPPGGISSSSLSSRLHLPQQGGGAAPDLRAARQGLIHRIELGAPVVTHRLQPEPAIIGEKFGIKEGARLEGVALEHPLAEAVDGVDGRLVHLPLGGQQQTGGQRSIVTGTPAARPAADPCSSPASKARRASRIRARIRPRSSSVAASVKVTTRISVTDRGSSWARADRRRPSSPTCSMHRAVTQQRPQVEPGDGIGLAGAGAGLE